MSSGTLNKHVIRAHSQEARHQCRLCERSFLTADSLQRHAGQLHAAGKVYRCHLCEKVYAEAKTLIQHVRKIHEQGRFDCPNCEVKLFDKRSLELHLEDAHGIVRKEYRCDRCRIAFRSEGQLARHVRCRHEAAKKPKPTFLCSECGKQFKDTNQLAVHLMVHNDGISDHQCGKCAKLFSTQMHLARHARSAHGQVKVQCSSCEKEFKAFSGLAYHNMVVHMKR